MRNIDTDSSMCTSQSYTTLPNQRGFHQRQYEVDAVAQPVHPTSQKSSVHKRNYATGQNSNQASQQRIDFYHANAQADTYG